METVSNVSFRIEFTQLLFCKFKTAALPVNRIGTDNIVNRQATTSNPLT